MPLERFVECIECGKTANVVPSTGCCCPTSAKEHSLPCSCKPWVACPLCSRDLCSNCGRLCEEEQQRHCSSHHCWTHEKSCDLSWIFSNNRLTLWKIIASVDRTVENEQGLTVLTYVNRRPGKHYETHTLAIPDNPSEGGLFLDQRWWSLESLWKQFGSFPSTRYELGVDWNTWLSTMSHTEYIPYAVHYLPGGFSVSLTSINADTLYDCFGGSYHWSDIGLTWVRDNYCYKVVMQHAEFSVNGIHLEIGEVFASSGCHYSSYGGPFADFETLLIAAFDQKIARLGIPRPTVKRCKLCDPQT